MSEQFHSPRSRRTHALTVDLLEVDDRTAVAAPSGDLDLWSSPELKRSLCELVDSERSRFVLDLSQVSFMDSTALGVMVGIHRRLGEGKRMAIAAARPEVLRVFELSGVATGFRVFATRDAALSYLAHADSEAREGGSPPLTADAALMVGIVSTAMPFAHSTEDQAERWLRALRNHGESGAILASLGLSQGPVTQLGDEVASDPSTPGDADAVTTITEAASRIAVERGAGKVGTTDVLRAVMNVYGATFYRVLAAHGVDPAELAARVGSGDATPAEH